MEKCRKYEDKMLFLHFLKHFIPHDCKINLDIREDVLLRQAQTQLSKKMIVDQDTKDRIDLCISKTFEIIKFRKNEKIIVDAFAKKARKMHPKSPFEISRKQKGVEFSWINKYINMNFYLGGFLPNNAIILSYNKNEQMRYEFLTDECHVLFIATVNLVKVINNHFLYHDLKLRDPISFLDIEKSKFRIEYSNAYHQCIQNTISCTLFLATFMEIFLSLLYSELYQEKPDKLLSPDKFNRKREIHEKFAILLGTSGILRNTDIFNNCKNSKSYKQKLFDVYPCIKKFIDNVYLKRHSIIHGFSITSESTIRELSVKEIQTVAMKRFDTTLETALMIWNAIYNMKPEMLMTQHPKYLDDLLKNVLLEKATDFYVTSYRLNHILFLDYITKNAKEAKKQYHN